MQDENELRQQPPPPPSQIDEGLPYEPRVRRNPRQGGVAQQDAYQYQYQQRGGENPPGMLALEDKLEKYAEGTFRKAFFFAVQTF